MLFIQNTLAGSLLFQTWEMLREYEFQRLENIPIILVTSLLVILLHNFSFWLTEKCVANPCGAFFLSLIKINEMKFKVKNEKVANDLGVKVGAIVEVLEQHADKWLRMGWGSEVAKKSDKEEKSEIETKELKIDKDTKDATDQD